MTIVEKAAYLKGLAEGLGAGADSKEGKLWAALNDLLADMAHEIEDLQASHLDVADALDEVSEELSMIEDYVYDLDSPEDMFDPEDEDDFEDSEDDEDEDEEDDGPALIELPRVDGVMYDVTCPVCGEEISLDEDMLAEGSIECPGCGETLEFDLQDDE